MITLKLTGETARVLAGICAHNITVPDEIAKLAERTDQRDGVRVTVYNRVNAALNVIGGELTVMGISQTMDHLYTYNGNTYKSSAPQQPISPGLRIVGGRAIEED